MSTRCPMKWYGQQCEHEYDHEGDCKIAAPPLDLANARALLERARVALGRSSKHFRWCQRAAQVGGCDCGTDDAAALAAEIAESLK